MSHKSRECKVPQYYVASTMSTNLQLLQADVTSNFGSLCQWHNVIWSGSIRKCLAAGPLGFWFLRRSFLALNRSESYRHVSWWKPFGVKITPVILNEPANCQRQTRPGTDLKHLRYHTQSVLVSILSFSLSGNMLQPAGLLRVLPGPLELKQEAHKPLY